MTRHNDDVEVWGLLSWENVAERSVKALKGLQGASSGESLAEREVDEFAERCRTAVDGLGEPQYCSDFTFLEVLARSDFK
ncbi:unnamed protein product [marine sediment metagenome]|uniref:Uncharacterized protein n=1 Tax=marine sediment metagenome TaxID=412755 RepID=X0YN91_9ZZZZ